MEDDPMDPGNHWLVETIFRPLSGSMLVFGGVECVRLHHISWILLLIDIALSFTSSFWTEKHKLYTSLHPFFLFQNFT